MAGERSDGEFRTADRTPEDVPTADLRTGAESSERLDAAFELLADPVRRTALYALAEAERNRLDVGSLADAVESRRPSAGGESSADDAQSLAVELHHDHLPRLESHGVVEHDPERRNVRYRDRAWLDEWLSHVRRVEGGVEREGDK